MKSDSFEYRLRRKAELSEFMGAKIDDLLEQEARQSRARLGAEILGSYIQQQLRHSWPVRYAIKMPDLHRLRTFVPR